MSRADEFIRLYNQLDDYLRKRANLDTFASFATVVDAASKSLVVRAYKDSLREYADLRNAIVHDSMYPSRIIAEPLEEVVENFAKIVREITSPPRLIPVFLRTIRSFAIDEPLIDAIQYMHDQDFSQIVVSKDSNLSLLTVEGVARWVGAKATEDVISVCEAQVGDALREEIPNTFAIMSKNKSIYDVREAFAHAIEQGRPRLFAVLITETGKGTEGPLGIVTPWDLLGRVGSN